MTPRAFLLAGAVLPLSVLPHTASATIPQVPPFAATAPVLNAQADISIERLAARDRYELALEELERARETLMEEERAGGASEAARLSVERAEEELAEARRALVEFVAYDVPRNGLEERAFRDQRAAQDDRTAGEAATDAAIAAAPQAGGEGAPGEAIVETPPAPVAEPKKETSGMEANEQAPEPRNELGDSIEAPMGAEPDRAPEAREAEGRDSRLTRDQRRQLREERRAAAESDPQPQSSDSVAGETAVQDLQAAEDPRPEVDDAEIARQGTALPGQRDGEALPDAADAPPPELSERVPPEVDARMTREERRRVREERRASARERKEGEIAGDSADQRAASREEDPAEETAAEEARRPSLAERLLGRRGDGAEERVTSVQPEAPADTTSDAETPESIAESPVIEPGMTREERRRLREERRTIEGQEAPAGDEAEEPRRPSLAERLMGSLGGGERDESGRETAESGEQASGAEPSEPLAAQAEEDPRGGQRVEPGMTREERRRLREERRAARAESGAETAETTSDRPAEEEARSAATDSAAAGEQPSLAERLARNRALTGERSADADAARSEAGRNGDEQTETVTADELQERRQERRQARRERLDDRGDSVTLNQIVQNQTTINQNQTTIDQSVNTNQTTVNQTITQQTVQQQQVIEQQRGPTADTGEAAPGSLDRVRRREERLARLEAEGRQRELQGELRATQRELDRTREALSDARLQRGDEVIRREPDRIIVRRAGEILVLRGDNENRFGLVEDVERFPNGYVRTVAVRGGIRIVTLYDPDGGIVRRSRVLPSGEEMVLIDAEPVIEGRQRRQLDLPPVIFEAPPREVVVETRRASTADIEVALAEPPSVKLPRAFTLDEVRHKEEVRDLVPRVDLDTITFEFDSAAIPEDQLITLEEVGIALEDILFENPNEVFLIEGHTDAPGSEVYNLSLSDRRAEAVAVALSQNFDVPPENLVTQGYGEQHLKVPTQSEERLNRRVSIRRITDLVNTAQAR